MRGATKSALLISALLGTIIYFTLIRDSFGSRWRPHAEESRGEVGERYIINYARPSSFLAMQMHGNGPWMAA